MHQAGHRGWAGGKAAWPAGGDRRRGGRHRRSSEEAYSGMGQQERTWRGVPSASCSSGSRPWLAFTCGRGGAGRGWGRRGVSQRYVQTVQGALPALRGGATHACTTGERQQEVERPGRQPPCGRARRAAAWSTAAGECEPPDRPAAASCAALAAPGPSRAQESRSTHRTSCWRCAVLLAPLVALRDVTG